MRIPIEPEVYDLIFTESRARRPLAGEPRPACAEPARHLSLQQAQRAPAAALGVRPAGRHHVLPGAAGVARTRCSRSRCSTPASCRRSRSDFAARLEKSCAQDRNCQIDTAWQLALARPPRPEETRLAREFFRTGGTLPDFCLALFNRNEFVYVP